jgi:hypothetical protein
LEGLYVISWSFVLEDTGFHFPSASFFLVVPAIRPRMMVRVVIGGTSLATDGHWDGE